MLDVDRGDYVDSRREQFLDVLVALFMLGAGDVGMRQFVDHRDFRLARQDRVDIHLLQRHAAVVDLAERNHFQVAHLGHGLRAPMRFDEAEHHVDALVAELMRLFEHPIGLAHPGRTAEINLEPALALFSDQVEEGLGRGTLLSHTGKSIYASSPPGLSAPRVAHPVQCQIELEHIDARFAHDPGTARPHRCHAAVAHCSSLSPRALATRGTWSSAAAGLISGSSPLPDAVTRSIGTCAGETPGFSSSTP